MFSVSNAQPEISPETIPVKNFIVATKTNDVKLFKSVWTSDIFENYFKGESANWKLYLKGYQKGFREMFKVNKLKSVNINKITYKVVDYRADGKLKIVEIYYNKRRLDGFFVEFDETKWGITIM